MKKILTLLVVLLMMPFVVAQVPPSITFHQFYGSVNNPAQGLQVTATVNNNQFTTLVDANNQYGFNPILLVDLGNNGDTVQFLINNTVAGSHTPFQKGGVTSLDLTYTGPPVIGPTCGDGTINQVSEQCEPPGSSTCDSNCQTITPSSSGGGGGGGRSSRNWYDTSEEEVPVDGGGPSCYDDWICTPWGPCQPNSIQIRECFFNDYADCTLQLDKPATEQSCSPDSTCYDNIQNQGEDRVDCGGPCNPCATCDDGIQNQDETGVDCGGSCNSCILEMLPIPTKWWMVVIFFLIILGVFAGVYYLYSTKIAGASTSSLKDYIKTAKNQKVPKKDIKKVLKKQGWKPAEIKKHI